MKASVAWTLAATILLGACPCPPFCRTHEVTLTRAQVEVRAPLPPPGQVDITVHCGDAITATVNPWSRYVSPHDTLHWTLAGTSSLQITPVPPPDWPFAEPAPSGDTTATAGVITHPFPDTTTVHYTITTHCASTKVNIDPEAILVPH